MKVVLPCLGEFGLKLIYHVPAVHVLRPDVLYGEAGEEILYPTAKVFTTVESPPDDKRRGLHPSRLAPVLSQLRRSVRAQVPGAHIIQTNVHSPRAWGFIPTPRQTQLPAASWDVFIAPRTRRYGASKNWKHWQKLADLLSANGLQVVAGGLAETSDHLERVTLTTGCAHSLDATVEAMKSSKVVVATDAGLAHLAMLCGRPLILITHGEGLVAPGPVVDASGRVMQDQYGPVQWERYHQANHRGVPILPVHYAWESPGLVVTQVLFFLEGLL